MFRLLGFLIGSATSIAIILLVTGLPEFHFKDPEIDQQRFDEAVQKLMARKLEAEQTAQRVVEDVTQAAESAKDSLPSPESDTTPPAELANSAPNPVLAIGEPSNHLEEADSQLAPTAAEVLPLEESQWYSFWNPFRSEIAANGFVSQLEKVTGLDYRVVRIKTGVYEVAFAYNDDDERRSKLTQISAATGLDLPDS